MSAATVTPTPAEQAWIDTPQDDYERKFPDLARLNKSNLLPRYRRFAARVESGEWTPVYSYWRHGGSYVDNLPYPSGAVGCIASARRTHSGRFELACPPADAEWTGPRTFRTRDAAARAEASYALSLWAALWERIARELEGVNA